MTWSYTFLVHTLFITLAIKSKGSYIEWFRTTSDAVEEDLRFIRIDTFTAITTSWYTARSFHPLRMHNLANSVLNTKWLIFLSDESAFSNEDTVLEILVAFMSGLPGMVSILVSSTLLGLSYLERNVGD